MDLNYRQTKPMRKITGGVDAPVYQGISTVRIGPGRGGRPTAGFWKFRLRKDDIYAVSRMGRLTYVSVHGDGRIHMHTGPRNNLRFAPPMNLSDGLWRHAIEVRFLSGPGAEVPPAQILQLKETDRLLLVPVPDGHMLILDLVLSASANPPAAPPREFSGAPQIWRTRLRDGRTVILFAKIKPFDEESTATFREVSGTVATQVGKPPSQLPYMEVVKTSCAMGNVLEVVSMGAEAHRFEPDEPNSAAPIDSREIKVECASASAQLFAPDGSVVGVISLLGGSGELSLVKDREVVHKIGHIVLVIYPAALRWGEYEFTRPRFPLECMLSVGGARPRSWNYDIELSFDGSVVTVSIFQLSTDFRKMRSGSVIAEIEHTEEIIVRAPVASDQILRLTANKNQVNANADLTCGFRLREI